jgi:hypothetical protein
MTGAAGAGVTWLSGVRKRVYLLALSGRSLAVRGPNKWGCGVRGRRPSAAAWHGAAQLLNQINTRKVRQSKVMRCLYSVYYTYRVH